MHRAVTAVLSLALTLSTVTACADQAEGPDDVSVTTERGEELVVDWDEGLTYEQQVEEIKLVVAGPDVVYGTDGMSEEEEQALCAA